MATKSNYGVIRDGKLVARQKPASLPLRGDTCTGLGERARSALGGIRKPRRSKAWAY